MGEADDGLSIDRTRQGSAGGAGAREPWSLSPDTVLGGYRVVEPLGRGGMGEVYLARNVQTGVRFALKLLPSDLTSDTGFRERFRREAAVLQTLRHDGIVMVHHAAEEGGRFFLTMDYVEGGSLDDLLRGTGGDTLRSERGHAAGVERRGPVSGGPPAARPADAAGRSVSPEAPGAPGRLSEEETARIAIELCDALGYAHGKGVIHRDLKPSNVLLDGDGRAKLSDFGLARVVGEEFLRSMSERSVSVSLSAARTGGAGLSQRDNAVIGTYEYMSPEQKVGAPADERSDVFSFGLMLYRMLTGEKAVGRFPDPSDFGCAEGWNPIIDRALATKPERRYASVGGLSAELGPVAAAIEAERARREAEEKRRREEEAARLAKLERAASPSGDGLPAVDTRMAAPPPSAEVLVVQARQRLEEEMRRGAKVLSGHSRTLSSVAFSPDGKLLATGSWDKTARLWSVADGSPVATLEGHSHFVISVAFSPDGRLLATGGYDDTARLWSVPDGSLVATLSGHSEDVDSVAFSPDGSLLATGSHDKTAHVWSVPDGSLVATLQGHGGRVCSVAFSPDGELLATGSADTTARLWSAPDGSRVARLWGHSDWVNSVAFSPDGKLLATGSKDCTARLWSVADGSLVAKLWGHSDKVSSVAFNPDGRFVAAGSWDDTARLWSVPDGSPVVTLSGHSEDVNSVAFGPDGRLLATGSRDSTARLWPLPQATWPEGDSGGGEVDGRR